MVNATKECPSCSLTIFGETPAHVSHTRRLQKGWFYSWFSEGETDGRSFRAQEFGLH
jgi:hypothetical protein